MTKWVTKTFVYREPEEDAGTDLQRKVSEGNGPDAESATIAMRGAASRSDFDAGYDAGYRVGWMKGYEQAITEQH